MAIFLRCCCLLSALGSFLLPSGVHSQPQIQADGNDIVLSANGEIILRTQTVGGNKVTLTQLSQVMTQLQQALDDVSNLKTTVAKLQTQLVTCKNSTDSLFQIANVQDVAIQTLEGGLQSNINDVSSTITGVLSSIDNIQTTQQESEEGIDDELKALIERLDRVDNKTTVTCSPIGTITNSDVHGSLLSVKHTVGFNLAIKCKAGYAVTGATALTCFPSGKYCAADDFPSSQCSTNVEQPKCEKCPDGCSACLPNDGGCTTCVKEDGYLLSGKCVTTADCAGYHAGGALKEGVNKGFDIALETAGKVTPSGACLVDSDDNVYEAFPCNSLLDVGQRCVPTSLQSQENTCDKFGYTLMSFRNRRHYELMYEAFGKLFPQYVRTTGVACRQDSNTDTSRPYTRCAMNSKGNTDCAKDWRVKDGGDWWLRSTPHSEPNGNAKKDWYLNHYTFNAEEFGFNDGGAAQSTGTFYFCMPKKQ